jgi:rhamnose transport system ATP-binding protein
MPGSIGEERRMQLANSPNDRAGPLIALHGIEKRFFGVHALKGVDLEVCAGEVHALVGENGAGKSTLMHILAGVHRPDAGKIDFNRQQDVAFANERSAQQQGIALVYQERSLFGPLSVAENIFAGRQPVKRWGRIDYRRLQNDTQALLDEVGLRADPQTPVERLSSAEQQLVEIAKALSLDARLIIFDEPTAALSLAETQRLFEIIRRLRAQGAGIIYISHRLEEVFDLADRATVLKDGRGQGTYPVSSLSPQSLVRLMVGRDVNPHQPRADRATGDAQVVLNVRGMSDVARAGARCQLRDISFFVRAGEIVGLAGLVGAGRSEVALGLFGGRIGCQPELCLHDKPVTVNSPAEAIAAGIGYLPEDRKESGLFMEMTVADNMTCAAAERFGTWHFDARRQHATAAGMCEALRIVCRGTHEPVKNLSGGNQQKVMLARWLLAAPRVLLVDEPTRGVDVGAKAEIHQLLFDQARRGAAVVVISSDLLELLALADRILVMREGCIVGELAHGEATEARIMELACAANAESSSAAFQKTSWTGGGNVETR